MTVLCVCLGNINANNTKSDTYFLDIAKGENRPKEAWLKAGGKNQLGEELGVNTLYWTRNEKPWTPVMGEFHFFRCPADLWETELLKMKAGGISIVATCIYWEYAEGSKGKWNWSGDNDLKRFVELCKKHGIYVWLRIGPYINAEIVRGGLPSWIDKEGKRSNAPWYLEESRKYYTQIADQIKGLYYKDGGPIIGCQLENEYAHSSKDHPASLKAIAQELGINVPFYSATANTEYHYEQGEILPLLGAYPYRFWEPPAPTSDFLYMLDEWGAMENLGRLYYDWTKFPRGMCELGGGCLNSYGHRFQVPIYDMEGSAQNVLGRGINLVTYYMYHGGSNKTGWASGGCPQNYDYQAPVGEFGQIRPSYHALKLFHMFMNDFGGILGPAQPVRSENMVKDPKDISRVKYVGRFEGDSGFLFMNTCQPWVKTQPVSDVQFDIKLSDETMKIPSTPITVPENTSPVFPVNLDMNGTTLRFSTARLMARVEDNGIPCFVFFEEKGITPEFQFDSKSEVTTTAPLKKIGSTVSYYPQPSRSMAMQATASDGRKVSVLLLSRKDAEKSWRLDFSGKPRLLISDANIIAPSKGLELSSSETTMNLAIFPKMGKSLLNNEPKTEGVFSCYTFTTPLAKIEIKSTPLPAKTWTVTMPSLPKNVRDVLFQVNYTGSTADLIDGKTRYTDNRHIGLPFEFSAKRFVLANKKELTVVANPWDNDVVGIPQEFAPVSDEEKQGMIRSVNSIPEYVISVPNE